MRDHEPNLYLSTVTVGELKFGIERLEDGRRKRAFQNWLTAILERMRGRVLSCNTATATIWGQMIANAERKGARLPSFDSQIAATAKRYSLIIVTRNEKDFEGAGVKVENPF
ncbi:MAG: type II toxin-antitoxin system VapC family toxin [Verrucomicrobiota bacterium]